MKNEPVVIPNKGREKLIVELAIQLDAWSERKLHKNGLLEVTFIGYADGFITRKILFDADSDTSEQILLQEFYTKGKIQRRITTTSEELFDENGNLEKNITIAGATIKQKFLAGFYGCEGKPAIEIVREGQVIEEIWYEGVRVPGEATQYGKIHRRPQKNDGKWCYEPARTVIEPSSGLRKEYRFWAGELQDTPDGHPAVVEKKANEILAEVRISRGMLHGCPAVKGSLDGGVSYEINADNGVISDHPDVPGISLKKEKVAVNVHFGSSGQVISRETILDFTGLSLDSESEYSETIELVQSIVRSCVMQKLKDRNNERDDSELFCDPF